MPFEFSVRVDLGTGRDVETKTVRDATYCQVGDEAVEFKDRNNKTVYAVRLERFVDATRIIVDQSDGECSPVPASIGQYRRDQSIAITTTPPPTYVTFNSAIPGEQPPDDAVPAR